MFRPSPRPSSGAYNCTRSLWFYLFFLWRCDPTRAMASSFLRFLDHTQRSTTFGRTPLDEWSARRRDLYLTTLTTDRHPVGFEPTIWAGERPQTYALDRATTRTGYEHNIHIKYFNQQDATISQVYYLTFMCGSTCLGRLPAHRQEHTTALGASGFTFFFCGAATQRGPWPPHSWGF